MSLKAATIWLLAALAFAGAASAAPRQFTDADFPEPFVKGPRPLLYLHSPSVWLVAHARFNACAGVAGGGPGSPWFVLYDDGQIVFARQDKKDSVASYYAVKLSADELKQFKQSLGAAATLKDYKSNYDELPGASHSYPYRMISWLGGARRESYLITDDHIFGSTYISGKGQDGAEQIPTPLKQLLNKLLTFNHAKAATWQPPGVKLVAHSASRPTGKDNKSLTWPTQLPMPADGKDTLLPGDALAKITSLFGTKGDCFGGNSIVAHKNRYWTVEAIATFAQEAVWQRPAATLTAFLPQLRSDDRETQSEATFRVSRAFYDREGVAMAAKLLRHQDAMVRRSAAWALDDFYEYVGDDQIAEVRNTKAGDELLAALGAMMKSEETKSKVVAAAVMNRLFPKNALAHKTLVTALGTGEPPAKAFALDVMLRRSKSYKQDAAAILPLLKDGANEVRVRAATLLSKIAPGKKKDVLAVAIASSNHGEEEDKRSALAVIQRLGVPPEAMPAVVAALADTQFQVRGRATEVLLAIKTTPQSARASLEQIVLNDWGYVRDNGNILLRRLATPQDRIKILSRAALQAKDPQVRYLAVDDLVEVIKEKKGQPPAAAACDAIGEALNDAVHYVKNTAISAVGETRCSTDKIRTRLQSLSESKDEDINADDARQALAKLKSPKNP